MKVLFFSVGDSSNASVWSNVPLCFSSALEKAGVSVVRVNLETCTKFAHFYNLVLRRIINIFMLMKIKSSYFEKTIWFKIIAEKKIKDTIEAHADADFCFFMGCGFYNKWSKTPSMLFSDWTTEMDILKKRPTNILDKRIIKQEEEAINHAEYVISLFPVCCEEMKRKYPEANIHFLGGNVINDLLNKSLVSRSTFQVSNNNADNTIIVEDLIEKKSKSKKLLFIGRKTTYLEAAKKLIEAYKLLKEEEDYKDFTLDIVGCSASDFDSLPKGVTCYGFLNKSEERDRKTYYDLLLGAKVLVNANPKWGAFSSTVEAMYYYTPVIVSPYQDFVKNFGEKIDFGVYNQDFTTESIAKDIISVLNSDNYTEMCNFAHEIVESYTWENYIHKLLKLIDN